MSLERLRSHGTRWPLLLLVGTVALGVGALVLTVVPRSPSSPADEVRGLVQRQIDMWNRSDFAALYQTLSPAVRRGCEYSVALGIATATRTYSGEISSQNLEVRVVGSTASVPGSLLIAGEGTHRISADDPAVYQRIGSY